jgi:hypothetical protein
MIMPRMLRRMTIAVRIPFISASVSPTFQTLSSLSAEGIRVTGRRPLG